MTEVMPEEFRLNFADVEDIKDMDALPSGIYPVEISDAKVVAAGPNAKYPGKPNINFEFTVTEGEYENRRVWDNIAVSEEALYDDEGKPTFGYKKLKAVLGAIGEDNSGDLSFALSTFWDKRLNINVGFQPADGQYKAKNTVRNYYPYEPSSEGMLG